MPHRAAEELTIGTIRSHPPLRERAPESRRVPGSFRAAPCGLPASPARVLPPLEPAPPVRFRYFEAGLPGRLFPAQRPPCVARCWTLREPVLRAGLLCARFRG